MLPPPPADLPAAGGLWLCGQVGGAGEGGGRGALQVPTYLPAAGGRAGGRAMTTPWPRLAGIQACPAAFALAEAAGWQAGMQAGCTSCVDGHGCIWV